MRLVLCFLIAVGGCSGSNPINHEKKLNEEYRAAFAAPISEDLRIAGLAESTDPDLARLIPAIKYHEEQRAKGVTPYAAIQLIKWWVESSLLYANRAATGGKAIVVLRGIVARFERAVEALVENSRGEVSVAAFDRLLGACKHTKGPSPGQDARMASQDGKDRAEWSAERGAPVARGGQVVMQKTSRKSSLPPRNHEA